MKKLKNYGLTIIFIFIFTSCSHNKRISNYTLGTNINKSDEIDIEKIKKRFQGVYIHGMSGNYAQNIKDKKLGEGLLYAQLFDIEKKILKDADSNNLTKKLKIKAIVKKASSKKLQLVQKEFEDYFQDNFRYISDSSEMDVLAIISGDLDKTQITLRYDSSIFDDKEGVKFVVKTLDINNLQKRSFDNWSTIEIPTNNQKKIKYMIMKNSVNEIMYFGGGLEDRSITNVSLYKADEWCYKNYKGSVSRIYIFEYALRQGLINDASHPAKNEIIAGFDSDHDSDDSAFFRKGDIVQSNFVYEIEQNEDSITDYSEAILYNTITNRYSYVRDSYMTKRTTFRCIKKVD